MKIGIIIQARMSSQRLPGKVLTLVEGKPLLQFLVESLGCSQQADFLAVATSVDPSDDPVEQFCKAQGIACFRGSLSNVAQRLEQAAIFFQLDAFVRVSGDSPLHLADIVDRCIARFRNESVDLVTNVFPRTFPKGLSVEVIRSRTFTSTLPEISAPSDLEHVTPFFYRNSARFRIENLKADHDYSKVNFCVDTKDDLDRFKEILSHMNKPPTLHSLADLVALYKSSAAPEEKS